MSSPHNIHNTLQDFEEEKLHIQDSMSQFNEVLHDFRSMERRNLFNEDPKSKSQKKIHTHILFHLEDQMEMIQKNFEKITHQQFEKKLEDSIYHEKIKNKVEELLTFSIDEYNQKTLQIENSIETICKEVERLMNELHDYIHHLHTIQHKMNFISKYEKMEETHYDLHSLSEMIDLYEKKIKEELEAKTIAFIQSHTSEIHDRFHMIQLLQSQLYQKVVTKYSCGICLTNQIDGYYPCGHVVCRSCGIKNRNVHLCPFCKSEGLLKTLFFI